MSRVEPLVLRARDKQVLRERVRGQHGDGVDMSGRGP